MTKKNKQLSTILYALAAVLALVAVCMMFTNVSALKLSGETGNELTGVEAVFGYETHGQEIAKFSFMNMLTYVLLIVGIVLVALRLFNVLKSQNADWVIVGLFVVAAVLYFLMPQMIVYTDTIAKSIETMNASKVLQVGSIVGGITSVLAAGLVVAKKLVK